MLEIVPRAAERSFYSPPSTNNEAPPGFVFYDRLPDDFGDATHVVNAPHKLPKAVQDLIRLQNEIAFRETGENISMISLAALEANYAVDGICLKKLTKKKKSDYLKLLMEQFQELMESLQQTYQQAWDVRFIHAAIKSDINAHLATLSGREMARIMPHVGRYRDEMRSIKQAIITHKKALTSSQPPDSETVRAIQEDLNNKTTELESIYTRFHRRFSQIRERRKQQAIMAGKIALAATDVFAGTGGMLTKAGMLMLENSMPLQFSSASEHRGGYEDPSVAQASARTARSSSGLHTGRSSQTHSPHAGWAHAPGSSQGGQFQTHNHHEEEPRNETH
jgi:hypothetical protein